MYSVWEEKHVVHICSLHSLTSVKIRSLGSTKHSEVNLYPLFLVCSAESEHVHFSNENDVNKVIWHDVLGYIILFSINGIQY